MLVVYGDESSDKTGARVFAVAGLIGRQEEWDDLEKSWIKRTGGKIFHAADCDSDEGDFKITGHQENKNLYKDLAKLLASTKLMGHGVAIDMIGYKKNFPDGVNESAYFICFTKIVIRLTQIASVSIPQDKVTFIFDTRSTTNYNSGLLYNHLANFTKWDISPYMDEISFGSSKSIGIQVADLWARETMKHLDNIIGPVKRGTRASMRTLTNTGRFKCDFYMQEFYDELIERIKDIEDGSNINRKNYESFLSDYGLIDNMTNRIEYIAKTDLGWILR